MRSEAASGYTTNMATSVSIGTRKTYDQKCFFTARQSGGEPRRSGNGTSLLWAVDRSAIGISSRAAEFRR
jgi:hypothetical protein